MTKVYVSRVIPAHPGAVWAIVRDFNALPEWTGFVAESRIEQNFPAAATSGEQVLAPGEARPPPELTKR